MKFLKMIGVLSLLSVFVVVVLCLSVLCPRFWTTTTEPPKDPMFWTKNTNTIKKVERTHMRIPNNRFLTQTDVKKRRHAAMPHVKHMAPVQRTSPKYTTATQVIRKIEGSPRFRNIHDSVLELDSNKYSCNDSSSADCRARTSSFGDLLQKELNRVVTYESRGFRIGLDKKHNLDVHLDDAHGKQWSAEQLRCALGSVRVRTVTGQDEPFAGVGVDVPAAPLQEGRTYSTCAVVSSAGSLSGSRLGGFIDSHEMVLRFNNAPTENYTEDVGSKTTFRILNSQIVTKPEYNFLEDPLYFNISIMIWDPARNATYLENWHQSPDYPVFDFYMRFLKLNPGADVHLLKPDVLWQLWNVLQSSAINRLRRNPPSSGFLGIWLAMHRCASVSVVGYVPSSRATERCHYYAPRPDRACTFGSWHPLAQEKNVANRMRNNSDFEAYQRGFITIPGVTALNCPD